MNNRPGNDHVNTARKEIATVPNALTRRISERLEEMAKRTAIHLWQPG
jgi:hypothetical protein